MPEESTLKPLPLLDLDALAQLESQLSDPKPAHAFARDYIAMFQGRYLRLVQAVGNRDFDAALEAALSLRNSSRMVGAARLSAMAAGFQTAVVSADLETALAALPGIECCGLDTIGQLEQCYLEMVGQDPDAARMGVSL